MKKRIISMLLVLAMVLTMLPAVVLASDTTGQPAETAPTAVTAQETTPSNETVTKGTLQFSTDLSSEPVGMNTSTDWNAPSTSLQVVVGTYAPEDGEATALPEGTKLTYAWYSSTDNVVSEDDTPLSGSSASRSISSRGAKIGTTYYYVVATASIGDVTYTGTSTVACVKIGAANISVTLTVNNKGVLAADKNGAAVSAKSVSVVDSNYDGVHTFDEALQAAHTSLKTASDYATTTTEYGLSVTKLWGVETTNTLFYLNGKALEKGVGETTVSANDVLYASINQDDTYYSDKFTAFDAATKGATVGVETELTLTDEEGNALSGMTIGTWESGAFVPMEDVTTDESGKVTLTFDKEGTYVISATGTIRDTVTDYSKWPETSEVEHDCPIMPPACTVTVKAPGELIFSGSFPTDAINFKVGEKASFASLFSAAYYINGTIQYAIRPTTTWYRIGPSTGGAAEQVNLTASTVFTEEDIGTWQYYMYAECEAYGVKYSTLSNMATIVVSRPTAIPGDSSNGYASDFTYQAGYPNNQDIGYEAGKTDYEIIHYDNGAQDVIKGIPAYGKGLWYGYRVNGIKDSASYNGADKEVNLTTQNEIQVTIPTTFKAGDTDVITILAGTKKDISGNGKIEADEPFDVYDAYNFTVNTLPAFSSLTVKDKANTNITLDKTVSSYGAYWASDLYGTTDSETVKISAQFKATDGVKVYVGTNEEAYTANLADVELTLADYKDSNGTANIPLKLVAEREDGSKAEHTVTLHLSPAAGADGSAVSAPTIKKQPAAESTVDKGKTVTLTVETETPAEGELSYQWLRGNNKLAYVNNGCTVIEGATTATFEAPAGEAAGDLFYWCKVGLTVDGNTAYTVSDAAKITTKLTWVNPPKFTIQPGIGADKNGAGIYKTEYTAGGKFDTLWMGIDGVEERIDGVYVWMTESGCEPYTVSAYYNSTPALDGATEITGTLNASYTGGTYRRFVGFTPDTGLPEGEWYVCVVIKSVAKDDPTKSASTASDFIKMTFAPADFGLDGKGSADDPYLLKTGDDFVTLQQQVANGNTLTGINFKMANDITLPEDWVAMGPDGVNGLFFGGVLDGGGYTLRFSKHSEPLIHHAKNAEIRNLRIYGEEIQGPALISSSWINQTMGAWIAKIDNVTLVSGTSTLTSGLVAGSASSYNPIYISNCNAEEGVIIGYDKTKSGIGTFAGGLVGTMTNCNSAATIYGVSNVGGLLGSQSNSMAAGNFRNCWFTGKIVATGDNVGGLMGAGYNSSSAPNGMLVTIQNCYVNAEITGKQNVGGFLGSNAGIEQAWDNGIGYVRNNVFYGTLTGEKNVGGLVGYYSALNKYNIIENNYFYDTNGHNAIGGVEHIDTSSHEFGMGDDGIFYYDTSRDDLADIKEFVDAEDKGTGDWQYTSVVKTNHNRTDDPMGADKDTLGTPVTAEAMADGTVLALLNGSETSLQNWIQGDKHPIIDDATFVTELSISGDYKDTYYIGDELDLTDAVFTATWSDGSTSTVAAEDVTVTGFDSSVRKLLTLVADYNGVTVEFQVRVINRPASTDINVTFTLYGDTIHGDPTEETGTHTWADQNLELWIPTTTFEVDMNATVKDVLEKALEEYDMTCENETGNYVTSITFGADTLGEFSNGELSGWMYTLNGAYPDLGVAEQFLEDGDVIVWHYTDDYTKEKSAAQWNVMDMINALPAVDELTADDADAVAAARAAYDALNEEQKAAISGELVSKLEAAEAKIAELTAKPEEPTELPFTDVAEGTWYHDAVAYVYENGMMSGIGGDKFGPDGTMTRSMAVTVLYRLAGSPAVEGTCKFTDCEAGSWYNNAVIWATENGVTAGTSDTTFAPDAEVTREQMATFLYRYAKVAGYDVSVSDDATLDAYPDASKVGFFATDALLWAVDNGIISGGTANGKIILNPQGDATRAQVAMILMRYCENIVQ